MRQLKKIGYARISTSEQSFDLQIDALKAAGCEQIFKETICGAKSERPILSQVLELLHPGDTLVIWKLDRFGRSLSDLIALIKQLNDRGIALKSVIDPIDTTSSHGRLIFNIFSSLSEFERELIRERTLAGLKSARARGRKGGRKPGLSPKAHAVALAARSLYDKNELSGSQIAQKLGISRATLYRYLKLMVD